VRRELEETPRSEVSASLRDLNSGSNRLPWTRVIFFGTSANGQRAVITIGPGVVCSRAVNGCSGPDIHDRTTAVKSVARRRATGGIGGRARSIARPRTASNSDAPSRSAIESGCASGKRRQLTRSRRARASALRRSRQIFWASRALDRVATSFSRFRMNIRASAFAALRAAWHYVACRTAKRDTGHGVGACVVSV
jgi:hypothetical protein